MTLMFKVGEGWPRSRYILNGYYYIEKINFKYRRKNRYRNNTNKILQQYF